MRAIRVLCLLIVAFFVLDHAGATSKNEMKGTWSLTSAKCSSGTTVESLKHAAGTFTYDGKIVALGMTDGQGKNESAFSSDKFVLQEDLLTVPNSKNGASTMKVSVKARKVLTLKIPLIGMAGECPSESDLQVLTFEKAKL